MNSLQQEKRQLRQHAKALRGQLDVAALSQEILTHVTVWPLFEKAQVILAYAALPGEIDIRSLIIRYPQKHWYLPRIVSDTRLAFHRIDAGDAFETNTFGIPEPARTTPMLSDIGRVEMVFVPALMLDEEGYRLGFGRGYYDRFLPTLPKEAITVCPVPKALWTEYLPRDIWDKPVAWGIHEKGIVHFQG